MSGSPAFLPAGTAAGILGVGRQQFDKLIDCGLLGSPLVTPGGQRKVELGLVLTLAQRGEVIPPPGPAADLAVHLAPLRPDPDPQANRRQYLGWHAAPPPAVTARQAEDAWAGLWNCHPEPYVGAALIGDVAGIVVTWALITGYRRVNGLVRFELAPAPREIDDRYSDRRFRAARGGLVQPLNPRTGLTAGGASRSGQP